MTPMYCGMWEGPVGLARRGDPVTPAPTPTPRWVTLAVEAQRLRELEIAHERDPYDAALFLRLAAARWRVGRLMGGA